MKENEIKDASMRRLWQLAGMQKVLLTFAGLFAAITTALSFMPYIAVYLIIAYLVRTGGVVEDPGVIIRYGLLALFSALGAVVINICALMCSHIAAFRILYTLRVDFSKHLAQLPLGFHTQNPSGKLRKIFSENIEKLEGFIAHQLPDIIGTLAAPVLILGLLFVIDWRFGIVTLIPIILSYFLLMAGMSGQTMKNAYKIYESKLEEMNDSAVEYARGVSVIKAFGQTVFSFRRLNSIIHDYTDLCLDMTHHYKPFMTAYLAVLNNAYLFIVPLSIFLISTGADFTKVVLSSVFYIIFSMSLPSAFLKIMYVSSKGREIASGIERMDKVFAQQPLKEPSQTKTISSFDVKFEDVSFSYEGDIPALSSVSFTAKQGEITALVGASGSGKSTIAHLIPRFFDVEKGAITIGGVDIRDMSYDYLMSRVSFVFQDLFLFKQTIAENIRVGKPDATDEELVAAAKAAMAHEFIMNLPDGYNTLIGAGVHLSGGEKQRIIIARAIIKNAPVIVLDEATAFADPENESKIQLAFEELMRDKTVVVIAHRLSSVRGADKIIVLDEGTLVESGKHDELLAMSGRYKAMWDSYCSALEWRIDAGGVNV